MFLFIAIANIPIFVLILWFSWEGFSEFGREVSKAEPRIVPLEIELGFF
jgi:hypothetical protein